jgi:hypothetical protein
MKKLILLFMCFWGIVVNNYAQYPIPSYNVLVFPKATFKQSAITPALQKEAPMAKRIIVIHVDQTIPDSGTNVVTVYVYSLDGETVLGPYYLTGNSTIYVEIDDRDWGVLVELQEKVYVSVWIDVYTSIFNLNIDRPLQLFCLFNPMNPIYRRLSYCDQRVIFPGACPGIWVQGLPWG